MNVRWDELYALPCPAAFLCNSTVIRTVLAIHVSCVNPATTPTCVTHLHVESNSFQNSCTNFVISKYITSVNSVSRVKGKFKETTRRIREQHRRRS
jgi:hypothetical protein